MKLRTYNRTVLLGALIALALGGFLIHWRIHHISQNSSFIVPFAAGVLSIIIVPALYCFKKTISYGYVLNGFLCIIGTVTMGHYAIATWSAPNSPPDIILKSMIIDIMVVWAKFFVGHALFVLETFGFDENRKKAGITYRYPNLGFWLIHLVGVGVVYFSGNYFWR